MSRKHKKQNKYIKKGYFDWDTEGTAYEEDYNDDYGDDYNRFAPVKRKKSKVRNHNSDFDWNSSYYDTPYYSNSTWTNFDTLKSVTDAKTQEVLNGVSRIIGDVDIVFNTSDYDNGKELAYYNIYSNTIHLGLPALKEIDKGDDIDFIRGLVMHELGHKQFTKNIFSYLDILKKKGSISRFEEADVLHMFNILEDVKVNNLMSQESTPIKSWIEYINSERRKIMGTMEPESTSVLGTFFKVFIDIPVKPMCADVTREITPEFNKALLEECKKCVADFDITTTDDMYVLRKTEEYLKRLSPFANIFNTMQNSSDRENGNGNKSLSQEKRNGDKQMKRMSGSSDVEKFFRAHDKIKDSERHLKEHAEWEKNESDGVQIKTDTLYANEIETRNNSWRNNDELDTLDYQTAKTIGEDLARRLSRILDAKKRKYAQRRNALRLNGRRLVKQMVKYNQIVNDNIFDTLAFKAKGKKHTVHVLLDNSGSMQEHFKRGSDNTKLWMAMMTGTALHHALAKLNIPHVIRGFTHGGKSSKVGYRSDTKRINADIIYAKDKKDYGLKNGTNHFDSKTHYYSLGGNADGANINLAVNELRKKSGTKVIFVVSDGQPTECCNVFGTFDSEQETIKATKKAADNRISLKAFGIPEAEEKFLKKCYGEENYSMIRETKELLDKILTAYKDIFKKLNRV